VGAKKTAIESRATTLLPREVAATHAGLAEGRAMKTKTSNHSAVKIKTSVKAGGGINAI
jgi:hypothetical protein